MSEASECEICYEKSFNWTCNKCRVKCCWSCLYECIVHTTKTDPTCPKCDSILSMKDIYDCIGKSEFKRTYIERLYRAELDHELQRVPELMPYCLNIAKVYDQNDASVYEQYLCDIADMSNIENIIQRILQGANLTIVIHSLRDIEALNPKYIEAHVPKTSIHSQFMLSDAMPLDITMTELIDVEVPRLCKRSLELNDIFGKSGFGYQYPSSIEAIIREIATKYVFDEADRAHTSTVVADKPKEPKYIFKCPNEECKGFIDRSYFCELCKTKFCKNCFVPLKEGVEHTCKEEDIATMKDILKNTKPCPKCKSRIYRSSGCAQMFCTFCHTGFDWNTGEIIVGRFHNPHRIEWIQSLGIEEFDEIEGNCEGGGIELGYYPSANRYYLNYQNEIQHYRRFIGIINRNLDHITFSDISEICRMAELMKYVLGWSKSFEKLTRARCLGDVKKRYLRIILDEYVNSMETVMRAIVQHTQSVADKLHNLYRDHNREDIIRSFFRELCEEQISSKQFEYVLKFNSAICGIFKESKERFDNEMKIIHEITDNANKELSLYKEIFGLKIDRIIYDDRHANWLNYHECGNAPMQTHKV